MKQENFKGNTCKDSKSQMSLQPDRKDNFITEESFLQTPDTKFVILGFK